MQTNEKILKMMDEIERKIQKCLDNTEWEYSSTNYLHHTDLITGKQEIVNPVRAITYLRTKDGMMRTSIYHDGTVEDFAQSVKKAADDYDIFVYMSLRIHSTAPAGMLLRNCIMKQKRKRTG